jgi:hypothetical protein
MFPLDGYLHRSVEAIPLYTSPPDQSAASDNGLRQFGEFLIRLGDELGCNPDGDEIFQVIDKMVNDQDDQSALLAEAAEVLEPIEKEAIRLKAGEGGADRIYRPTFTDDELSAVRSLLAKLREVR